MYNGGKNGAGVYQTIINQMPPHEIYIEAFLGSGAIMRQKKPAKRNIGIEINQKAVTRFWQDPGGGIEVIQDCAIAYIRQIKRTISKQALIYADPPYPLFARAGLNSRLYDYELTDQQHIEFLGHAKELPCMICISSYPNELYDKILKGWRILDFTAQTRKGTATERLYMNYPEPKKLHDYSYLGCDRTDRQRIKAKIHRQVAGLLKLPVLEREAILEAFSKSM
jgi:DNA adenine methylase